MELLEGEEKEMSFWDHLEEFRWMLLRSVIALLIFTIAAFIAMPYIFDNYILAPAQSDFILYRYLCMLTASMPFIPDFCNQDFQIDIINLNLTSQFFRHMSTSFWLAILMTFPYLIFEIWKFVSPALYANEKKNMRWVFLFGTCMFFLGCAFGYFLVFPVTFRFLAGYELSSHIQDTISLESYMDNFIILIFAMGIAFQLPLVSWFLSKLGLINRSFFSQYRRHAVVILLVVVAIITPSGDPFTLGVVFIPLYILYELSAFFVKPAPKEEDENENDEPQLIEKGTTE